MTLKELKAKKIELGLTTDMISKASGIPKSTVEKIFGGTTKAPRKTTLEAIENVLAAEAAKRPFVYVDPRYLARSNMLRDSSTAYGSVPKKKYTIDDYYALPEDQRMELIDGVFYDMGAPSMTHQRILGDLYILFRECTDHHAGHCDVYLSPCDVRLDRDNYTMVQPDLLVICRDYDKNAIRYEGAPDLAVEILSPSTRSKDMVLKLYKYKNAGVREYWIIDPAKKVVIVHRFEEENYTPEIYTFDSVIPIGISGGECSIDFSRVAV
ncbi:MAG: Uma2 family endonuclease [Blautia sp.]|nr:Uma2 family endonuclease [Blautia sp.]